MASHRRGPWSQAEDAYLTQLVHTQGPLNWVRIAQLIGSRSPKQCRERYHQNLKPTLNHEPISPEEGLQIERLVNEIGKKWAEIARRLRGRSDNAVKNWWNGSMNRRRRLVVRRRASSRCHNEFNDRLEPLSFAGPHSHQPLTITSNFPSNSRHLNTSLPSPVTSVISRADSVEGAPSLVSDCGSSFSVSPRGPTSPYVELPPLASAGSSTRRPSPSMLQFGLSAFVSEADTQGHAFSARLSGDQKYLLRASSNQNVLYQRQEIFPPHTLRTSYFDARPQSLTAPPTPVQLPPINYNPPLQQIENGGENQRDSRMHLSSVLL
jgi:Myb-like DNA-binding protein FlbD